MFNKPRLIIMLFSVFMLFTKHSQAEEFKQGLVNGKLRACPDSPNCVNSETGSFDPINLLHSDPQSAWSTLQQVIVEQGGQIKEVKNHYLWAEFTTPLLGFTDDVEARLDVSEKKIHLRSASRVGYYDFGANRKRLQNINKAFQLALRRLSDD